MAIVKERNNRLFLIKRKIGGKLLKAAVAFHILWPADHSRRYLPRFCGLGQLFPAAIFPQYEIQHIQDIVIVRNIEILADKRVISHITHFSGHDLSHSLRHGLHFLHSCHIGLFSAA